LVKITNEFRQFSNEVQMANKYTKKYLTSLALKKMQIKTTIEIPSLVRKIIKKANNNKYW
jgi:hypothetical protein